MKTTMSNNKTHLLWRTGPYNRRRYGKPWCAVVEFESASKTAYKWGGWCGDTGSAGLLELHVQDGDIIAVGQTDYRKPRNSAHNWFCVVNAAHLRNLLNPRGDGNPDINDLYDCVHHYEDTDYPCPIIRLDGKVDAYLTYLGVPSEE